MNRQTPTEPVTSEITLIVNPEPGVGYPVPDPLNVRVVYNWRSHPIRFGLHEMGKLAESVRWHFPPARPYGVTREPR